MSSHVTHGSLLRLGGASLVSLLSGVVLTLVFAAETLEAVPSEHLDPLLDVSQEVRLTRARMDRLERVVARELAATRRDLGQRRRSDSPGRVGANSSPVSRRGGVGTSAVVARETTGDAPCKRLDALAKLEGWKTDDAVRSEWMFASERSAFAAFGTPDRVTVHGTSEWWSYWVTDGDSVAAEYRLKLNKGRLVEGSMLRWPQPRSIADERR